MAPGKACLAARHQSCIDHLLLLARRSVSALSCRMLSLVSLGSIGDVVGCRWSARFGCTAACSMTASSHCTLPLRTTSTSTWRRSLPQVRQPHKDVQLRLSNSGWCRCWPLVSLCTVQLLLLDDMCSCLLYSAAPSVQLVPGGRPCITCACFAALAHWCGALLLPRGAHFVVSLSESWSVCGMPASAAPGF